MSGEEVPVPKSASRWPAALFGGIVGALLSVVVLGAAAYNKRIEIRTWLLSDDEMRLGSIETQINDVSGRLEKITTEAAKEPPDTAKLESQIAELRRSVPAEGLILRLTERVEAAERAERELTQAQAAASALLLTVGQLRDAVDRGDHFDRELAAARQMAKGDELSLLDGFAAGAGAGIPRRDTLRKDFDALSEKLLQQEADSAGPGLWNALSRNVRKVISLRRMDGKGNDAEAVAARADAALQEGDWDKAVQEMTALPGPYQTTADDWIRQARLRLAADRALSQLAASAAARTAPH
jgi:hypothetical protein